MYPCWQRGGCLARLLGAWTKGWLPTSTPLAHFWESVSLDCFVPFLGFWKATDKICIYEAVCAQSLLCNLWMVVHQASLSMGFPRQECGNRLPFPTQEHLRLLQLPHWQVDSLIARHQGSPLWSGFSQPPSYFPTSPDGYCMLSHFRVRIFIFAHCLDMILSNTSFIYPFTCFWPSGWKIKHFPERRKSQRRQFSGWWGLGRTCVGSQFISPLSPCFFLACAHQRWWLWASKLDLLACLHAHAQQELTSQGWKSQARHRRSFQWHRQSSLFWVGAVEKDGAPGQAHTVLCTCKTQMRDLEVRSPVSVARQPFSWVWR